MNGAHLWRFAVEHEIVAMRRDFENRFAYVLGQEADLMLKLAKKNGEKFDYFAALISATKAPELVMRHIYLKLNITEYTEMRKKDKKFCFKDWIGTF